MGTFSRLRYVIAANVNALIEKAEDPEKLLHALVREMEDASEEARLASADMLAEQRHLQRLTAQLAGEAEQWQTRARKAVEEHRDDLARAALKARAEVTSHLEAAKDELTRVGERIAQMEQDMLALKTKMSEVKLKLKRGYCRATAKRTRRSAESRPLSPSEKRVQRALGRFDRLQTQVENLEARVQSYELGGREAAVWDTGTSATDPMVEDELQRLKQKIAQPGEQDQSSVAV